MLQMKREPHGPLGSPQTPGSLFSKDYRIRISGHPVPEYNQPCGGVGLSSALMVCERQRIWGQALRASKRESKPLFLCSQSQSCLSFES